MRPPESAVSDSDSDGSVSESAFATPSRPQASTREHGPLRHAPDPLCRPAHTPSSRHDRRRRCALALCRPTHTLHRAARGRVACLRFTLIIRSPSGPTGAATRHLRPPHSRPRWQLRRRRRERRGRARPRRDTAAPRSRSG